jgi:hypothetical protein
VVITLHGLTLIEWVAQAFGIGLEISYKVVRKIHPSAKLG